MFDVDDDRNPEEKKNGFVFDAIDEGVSTRVIDEITFGRESCCISLTFIPSNAMIGENRQLVTDKLVEF